MRMATDQASMASMSSIGSRTDTEGAHPLLPNRESVSGRLSGAGAVFRPQSESAAVPTSTHAWLKQWWAYTTNPEYLSSPVSRRDLWPALCFLVLAMHVAFDFREGFLTVPIADVTMKCRLCIDIGLGIVVAVGTFILSSASLQWDGITVTSVTTFTIAQRFLGQQSPLGLQVEVIFIFALALGGANALAVSAYSLLCAAVLFCTGFGGLSYLGVVLVSGAVVSTVGGILDYRLACSRLQSKTLGRALEKVLDQASDGYFGVDADDWSLCHTSPGFLKLFGPHAGNHGANLSDVLEATDKRRAISVLAEFHKDFVQGGEESNGLRSVTVTGKFSSRPPGGVPQLHASERPFTVKLIPYAASEGSVEICLRLESAGVQASGSFTNLPLLAQGRRDAETDPNSSMSDSSSLVSGSVLGPDQEAARRLIGWDDCADGFVGRFKPTDISACKRSMAWVLLHWNLPRSCIGCCVWHTATRAAQYLAMELGSSPCNALWSPLTGWQCTRCGSMNDASSQMCDLCGASKMNLEESTESTSSQSLWTLTEGVA